MAFLSLALIFLLVSHFGLSRAPLRQPLIGRIGEGGFMALYSLISVGALIWVILAYRAAPYGAPLWSLGALGAGLAWAGSLLGMVMLVTGLSGPNPSAFQNQSKFEPETVAARGILRVTRNPLMWGVGCWALGHLAANGEPKVVLTLLAMLILSAGGTVVIDAKMADRRPAAFAILKDQTSNLPFAALVTGRQSWRAMLMEIGILRPLVAVVLFGVVVALHRWIAGIPLLPF